MNHRPEDTVSMYRCGWMSDYLYGYMVPSTGYLRQFGLKFYLPGVIIQYPSSQNSGQDQRVSGQSQIVQRFPAGREVERCHGHTEYSRPERLYRRGQGKRS
jgi:uridine kinase